MPALVESPAPAYATHWRARATSEARTLTLAASTSGASRYSCAAPEAYPGRASASQRVATRGAAHAASPSAP